MLEKILKDEKGVTVVLGALLILGIAAVAIPPWYNYYVESTMEDQEIKHMESVESSFRNIQDQISWMNEGESGTINIQLDSGDVRFFSGSSPQGSLEFKSGSDYEKIIGGTSSFSLTWDTESDWLDASATENIQINGTDFHLKSPIETAMSENNENYTYSENNGFWEDHRVATGVNVDGISSMDLVYDYNLVGENNENRENITLDNYLDNSGGSSNGEGTVLYYENAANVKGMDWMDIRSRYAIDYGYPRWSVHKPENLTGGSWFGEYSSIENLDETQDNFLTLFEENTFVVENQVLQNGDFIDNKEPWTINRIQTGGTTQWTGVEQYVRGGSIESWAANGNTEEAYVTQTFDGFTSDNIVGDLTFSGAYMINVVDRSPKNNVTITYQIRDGGTWQNLFTYSNDASVGWTSQNTTYAPTGVVDAIRAHITVPSDTHQNKATDVYAYVDNISLTGSFERGGGIRENGYRISESYQTGIENVENSEISWVDNEPAGTNVSIYTAITGTNTPPTVNSSEWVEATNGTTFVNKGDNLAGNYLWFKQVLSTTTDNGPQLESLDAYINGENVEGEIRFEVDGEERITWSGDTGGSFVQRENSVDVSGSDQVTVAFYMDAGNRILENALVEIDWAQHEYVKEFSGEADENRAGVRILVDGTEVFNDNAIGPVTNTFNGTADVSGKENVDVQFQYWTEDNSEVNIFKTSYEYVDNTGTYPENGYLETDAKNVSDNGQPNLTDLSYDLNGENIKLEVIGSPNTANEEIINQELTGGNEYDLGWTNNHDNFKIRIRLETENNQVTPVFDSVSLEKVSESKITSFSDLYYYQEGKYEDLWRKGYSNGSVLQSKEGDHLYLSTSETPSATSWVTRDPVDLKEIENIWIDWQNTGQTNGKSYLIVSDSKFENREVYRKRLEKTGSFNRENNSLDVSNLENEYYLRIHAVENQAANSASELSTYRIWGSGSIENIPSYFVPEIKELDISLYPSQLKFSGTNYHFPDQDFIYESGQVILSQDQGHLILSEVDIINLNEEEKTIELEYPKLVGENNRVSSSGTESLNFQYKNRKKNTWTVENTFQITIETNYESAWKEYLQKQTDNIEEKFEISNRSIEIANEEVSLIIKSNEKINYSIVEKIISVQ